MKNETCFYSSKETAPAGVWVGDLVSAAGKFLGQIRKTNKGEFTVYGPNGIIGKYGKTAFKFSGYGYRSSKKSTRQFTLA